MNEKEWGDIKQASPTQKITVDFANYLFTDHSVTSQRVNTYIDKMLELELDSNHLTLSKSDILMMCLAAEITPEQYEFFYNKHMLNTPLTNKGE